MGTELSILEGLPAFCTQPHTQPACLSNTQGHFIAYEKHRDFLSTPRAFVILCYANTADIIVKNSHKYFDGFNSIEDEYETIDYGVYYHRRKDHENIIFYSAKTVIHVEAGKNDNATLHNTVPKILYRAESPEDAITLFLEQQL